MPDIKLVYRDAAKDAKTLQTVQAAVQSGQIDLAIDLARRGLDDGVMNSMLLNLRSSWHNQQGRDAPALADLRLALELDPNDVFVRNALGVMLGRRGQWGEALTILHKAVEIAPDFAPAHFSLGWVHEFTGELAKARAAFEQAVALNPLFADALGHLSSLAYRRSDAPAMQYFADRALAVDPHQPVALTALAAAAVAAKDFPAAETYLTRLGNFSRLQPTEASLAETALGDLRDAQGRSDDAFAAYARRNQAKFRHAARQFDSPESTITHYVQWLAAYFAAAPRDWAAPPPDAAPDARSGATGHVFLVGFPRSGTTLLENVLASHPRICALDERDTLGEAARAYLVDDAGRDRLASISADEIAEQRKIYWDRVRNYSAEVSGKIFVDKYPLSSIKLPLVAKLFPEAKILFALRDPRDVLWSCYRRVFSLNSSMFELLDLERGARFYSAVMGLRKPYQEKLGLAWHDLRYENLVGDFESEVRAACAFIGVEWDAQMADFAELSKSRVIKTPSSTQVVRGLYQSGAGQWRPYVQQLAPVMPILRPWVEEFGYPEN